MTIRITMAEEANPDLDLAFQLQIQEAMFLSLSLSLSLSHDQPSSSRSSPGYDDDDDQDSPIAVEQRYYEDDEYDDVLAALKIQDEEAEIYERDILNLQLSEIERSQSVHDEIERRRLETERINSRIEEQRLAGEGAPAIPKKRCCVSLGLYDEASSSSSTVETEIYRVFFKGLVVEVGEGESAVTVAAIGAAICDSRENVVYRVGRALRNMEGMMMMSREGAEIEALVEGLRAAFTLRLKTIALLCDDPMVYQYFSGGDDVGSYNSKVSPLRLSKAISLRTKFMYCCPFLVGRNEPNPAFKLATDSLLSQIPRPPLAAIKTPCNLSKLIISEETCEICMEDTIISNNMFTVEGCLHRFCSSCVRQHLEVKLLNDTKVPKCPHQGCTTELSINNCKELLTPESMEKLKQRIEENAIPVTDRIYCPYLKCSVPMSKFDALKHSKSLKLMRFGARKCVKCHKLFCINCRVPWHDKMGCSEYKKLYPYPNGEYAKLNTLAANKRWRECAKCSHMIELAEGCYHMTCRCGYQFCYTCGAEWRNKKPTCYCPIWDEHNIIRQ